MFSLSAITSKRDNIVFWSSLPSDFITKLSPVAQDWFSVFTANMLSGNGELAKQIDWFISADTSKKIELVEKYSAGCNRNTKNTKMSKEVEVADSTDKKDEPLGLNTISDCVLKCVEESYDSIVTELSFVAEIEELNDMRSYILGIEKVDIYFLLCAVDDMRKGVSAVSKKSAEILRELSQKYYITDLLFNVMSKSGAIDYIRSLAA